MNYELQTKHKGFSLAEAMLATAILSIAAAGVLVPFTTGAKLRAEGIHRTLAARLASDLVEQIVNTDFDQITTQYGAYSEAQGHLIMDFQTGAEFSDPIYANFSRDATCAYVYVPQETGDGDAKFVLATVRVYYKASEVAAINRLVSK